jgi:hypothetical protein
MMQTGWSKRTIKTNLSTSFTPSVQCKYPNSSARTTDLAGSSVRIRYVFAAARLAATVDSNPSGDIVVWFEKCVFSGRGLYDDLITRPEESY